MTTSLTRLVAFESRRAAQTVRTAGTQRKRGDWICEKCRAGRAAEHRRAFGHGARFPTKQAVTAYPSVGLYDGEERVVDQRRISQETTVLDGRTPEEEEQSISKEIESLWEDSEQAEEATVNRIITRSAPKLESQKQRIHSPLLKIDYVSALPQALANNEPDKIARCLAAAGEANDTEFIQKIPRTTFAECIRLLQPCNFTESLTTAHLEISDAVAKQLGLSSIRQVAWQHTRVLRNILLIRRKAGVGLGLSEYKMLLRAAQDLGMRPMSAQIWDLLIKDGHVPDTDCYNYRMSAAVWNDVHQPLSRHTVRVTKFFQERRSRGGFRGQPYLNYRLGPGGLKNNVTGIFNEMLKSGAVANEKSFRTIILAAAREGDLKLVKSVLRKVWKIDVDALIAGKLDPTAPQIPKEQDWKLEPTSSLLFTLAHAFGINNDIPTALRVVDDVASRYHIDIDTETWRQLFEYTFVLAVKRSGKQSEASGAEVGKLPVQSILSLWDTMTSPPYSVQPTMGMYNYLIRNLQQRDSPGLMYEKMREALNVSLRSRNETRKAFNALSEALEREDSNALSPSLELLRRRWENLRLISFRNLFWLKRWSRLLLSTLRSINYLDVNMDWALRRIPRFLWDWRHFIPTLVRYDAPGGMVEFNIRTREEVNRDKAVAESEAKEMARIRGKLPLLVEDPWRSRQPGASRLGLVKGRGGDERGIGPGSEGSR